MVRRATVYAALTFGPILFVRLLVATIGFGALLWRASRRRLVQANGRSTRGGGRAEAVRASGMVLRLGIFLVEGTMCGIFLGLQ